MGELSRTYRWMNLPSSPPTGTPANMAAVVTITTALSHERMTSSRRPRPSARSGHRRHRVEILTENSAAGQKVDHQHLPIRRPETRGQSAVTIDRTPG